MLNETLSRVGTISREVFDGIRDLDVETPVSANEIREHLARYDFKTPLAEETLIDDVASMLRRWGVHVVHPRYFGLFNPSVRPVSVAADALVAAFNPQLATWSHAPGANEIERHVLHYFLEHIGFDRAAASTAFTSGGQEANMCAVLAALTYLHPDVELRGVRALPGDPVFYISAEGHHSFQKIAHAAGLGRHAVRVVEADGHLRMDMDACGRAIETDRRVGRVPFMVVATAGTTGAGAIDPLPALADLCVREQLWLHVDAAWGGSALLSPRLRPLLAGIDRADSVTWDAHKWLSVPVGAGMFFCRWPDAIGRTFHVSGASYVPPNLSANLDPYTTTIQWSRRFIGLKVFMALAEAGADRLARTIDHHAEMADRLRASLETAGWIVVNDSPLAIVCFTHPAIRDGSCSARQIVDAVNGTGRAWLSDVTLTGRGSVLRACVTSYRTNEDDVRVLMQELERARERETA